MGKIKLELMDWMAVLDKTKEQLRELMLAIRINKIVLKLAEREISKFEVKKDDKAAVAI